MLMNRVLDSSNSLRDPDECSRPLKRSASVASLPTPPRTHHKHSRSRPRTSLTHESDGGASASELDDNLGRTHATRTGRAKVAQSNSLSADDEQSEYSEDESPERKKRRTLTVLPGHDEEEDENEFWTGRSGSSCREPQEKVAHADEAEDCSPSPALLRYHVKAPVSPPPSRRLPSTQARATSVERDSSSATSRAPVTPPPKLFLRATSPPATAAFKTPTKPVGIKIWPKRDSPNNPFLVESSDKVKSHSEWDSSDDDEGVVGEARAREETPTPVYEEKPTITYVFRGQKATFQNPLYGLAPQVIAASRLPIDHPDYEATEACPPKRLFLSGGKRKPRDHSHDETPAEANKRVKFQDAEDKPPEGEQGTEASTKLVSAPAENTKGAVIKAAKPFRAREERQCREVAAKNRLAPRDGLRAGAIFAERDEPVRRAMGPLRST